MLDLKHRLIKQRQENIHLFFLLYLNHIFFLFLVNKLEIILDGGVRRGTHVLKALAAGATACSFGKMFLFSLAAGGQQGVEHLLQNMHDEIYRNMVLMGCKNLKELNSSKLIYR